MTRSYTLYRPVPDDWEKTRELRLRMVLDTPIAFLESPDEVRALDEQAWRERMERQLAPGSTRVVAVDEDGRWVGSMSAFVSEGSPGYVTNPRPGPPRANLVGVFIDPEWRGEAALADVLLERIAAWARDELGLTELYLHVGEANARARRYYVKRGFRETGVVDAIPEQPGIAELEMVLAL